MKKIFFAFFICFILSKLTFAQIGNTAYGNSTLNSITTASYNSAFGYAVLYSDTTGNYNAAIGYDALYSNTSGSANTANGYNALYSNTSGWSNTAIGYNALYSNTGFWNTANGSGALYSNTSGMLNTATGLNALYSNIKGSNNTANGSKALYSNGIGGSNTANGFYALYHNTSGDNNTALGLNAGYNVTTGSNNSFVGYNANCGAAGTLTNSTAIGNGANVTTSNAVRIGNSSVTSIGGYANWSNISDARVKKNIKANVPGLTFINKLKPVTYNLNLDAADKITQLPAIKDKAGETIQPSAEELTARKEKEQIIYTGFIAQDVEKAAKELNYDFSGVDAAKNEYDLYALRYAEFVVPLVKAVQELSTQNDNLSAELLAEKNQNDLLVTKVDNLQKQIDELKAMIVSRNQLSTYNSAMSNELSVMSGASLQQNIPNPFNHTTMINYTLPKQYLSAKIIIVDELGKTIKSINLSGAGKGSISFSSPFRAAAAYQYSLYVDGRLVQNRQMLVQQ